MTTNIVDFIVILICGSLCLYWLTSSICLDRRWRREDEAARAAALIRRITGPWD
jgi:hypothetical protein